MTLLPAPLVPYVRQPGPKPPVLIIDDDHGPRESLKILLKYDFDIEMANSVAGGVECLRARAFDAVVLDNRMPDRNGIEGIADLREVDPDVSIILLTGYGSLDTAIAAFRHQANDFLTKPPDTDLMIATVGKNVGLTRAKRARSQLSRELSDLNLNLASELRKMQPMALMGQRTDEIIHDLGNPLTILTCCIELLQAKAEAMQPQGGDDWIEALGYIHMIKKSVEHCCGLTETWRHLRDDIARAPVLCEAVAFLRETVEGLDPLAAQLGVSLHLDDTGFSPQLRVPLDAFQMRRVVHNLIANAMQAAAEHGRAVRVSGRTDGGEFEIAVADNGPGISAERLGKIFEPYFTTKQSGTGLGLAISKRIVGEHGGTLTAESQEGTGSTFRVRLPLESKTTPAVTAKP